MVEVFKRTTRLLANTRHMFCRQRSLSGNGNEWLYEVWRFWGEEVWKGDLSQSLHTENKLFIVSEEENGDNVTVSDTLYIENKEQSSSVASQSMVPSLIPFIVTLSGKAYGMILRSNGDYY